jgi:hypothetical protein
MKAWVSLLGIFLLHTVCSLADGQPELRYGSNGRSTNVYRVEIEALSEQGKEILGGFVSVISSSQHAGKIDYDFRGMVQGRWEPPPGRGAAFSYIPSGYYPAYLGEGCSLQFNEHGQILSEAGNVPLACPLGSLMQLFVEPLPHSPTNAWEVRDNATIVFHPSPMSILGPASITTPPNNPAPIRGRPSQVVYPVTRQMTYATSTNETSQILRIKKQVRIESALQVGDEPRIDATGDGEIIFDRGLGAIRESSLKCKTLLNSETMQGRRTTTLSLKLLEGAERERVLRPPQPISGVRTNLTPQEIQRLTQTIVAPAGSNEKLRALARLNEQPFTNAPVELVAELARIAANPNDPGYYMATALLAKHCNKSHVPLFLEMLKQKTSVRNTAMAALGQLQEKRAIGPLCEILAGAESSPYYGYGNSDAADALIKIGPEAEPPVLELLKTQKSVAVRRQACSVLREIGTKRSLPTLKEVVGSPNEDLSKAAAEAIREIQKRS